LLDMQSRQTSELDVMVVKMCLMVKLPNESNFHSTDKTLLAIKECDR
jgi:hypothetical protein